MADQATRSRPRPARPETEQDRAAGEAVAPPAAGNAPPGRSRLDPGSVAAKRAGLRRRRTGAVLLMLAAAALVGVDLARGGPLPRAVVAPPTTEPPSAAPTAPTAPAVVVPSKGANTFAYAGQGRAFGSAGTLRKYRVAVENGSGVTPGAFAAAVDAILADPRGWTASGKLRLQRVAKSAAAEFTVYLATPATSERMCAVGGLHTDGFASCRLKGQVIINLARWLTAVPDYGAPLKDYQAYALNHEVGHQLGRGHEACKGPGDLAPVMQQQTYGLRGCLPNSWPYVDGKPYTGPAVP
ncbi:DUF3152 domain-containing protein [Rhizomonospora bruguierae]|uniref:DUF3152 domain-containing protein n=1 Tax=Rhizomonospora bruguierae TaxID=1581705 RepID=UPI001BCFD15A|nr:DUF3152 domain-containing protein [Micromonospora sp. NBRC 107566]